MKRFVFVCICIACLLPINAFAASITDHFDSPQNEEWYSYHNLKLSVTNAAVDFGWSSAPDATALSITSPANTGIALYAVSGAQKLTVSIYSTNSTIATKNGEIYQLGYVNGCDLSQFYRTKLSKDGRNIYINTPNKGWQKMYRAMNGFFVFAPLNASVGETTDYGVSVFCSTDNKSFHAVSSSLLSVRSALSESGDNCCYYETYSCPVPAGTNYIRLELREMRSFPDEDGAIINNTASGSLRFAQVSFIGDVAKGSFTAPSVPEPQPSSSSSSSPLPSSSSSDPDLQSSNPNDNSSKDSGKSSSKPKIKKKTHATYTTRTESKSKSSASSSSSSSKKYKSSSISSNSVSSSSSAKSAAVLTPSETPNAPTPAMLPEGSAPGNNDKKIFWGGIYIVLAVFALAFLAKRK